MFRVRADISFQGTRKYRNVSITLVHLTQSTAVEFNSHGNVAIPTPDIYAHITSHKWPEETMGDYKVSLDIGFEYLK